jgi:hypothetical protein
MAPPRSSQSSAARRRRGAGLLLAALLGCAGGAAPWDVREGDEGRFERAQRECRMLTVDASGSEGPIPFDQCMNRRGFERMGPITRLFRGA